MNIYQLRKHRDPKFLEKTYDRRRQREYGISPEIFEEMALAQGYRCPICRRKKLLVVDHDHESGVVRGLLCQSCNSGLGFFKDNPVWLKRAARYLLR